MASERLSRGDRLAWRHALSTCPDRRQVRDELFLLDHLDAAEARIAELEAALALAEAQTVGDAKTISELEQQQRAYRDILADEKQTRIDACNYANTVQQRSEKMKARMEAVRVASVFQHAIAPGPPYPFCRSCRAPKPGPCEFYCWLATAMGWERREG